MHYLKRRSISDEEVLDKFENISKQVLRSFPGESPEQKEERIRELIKEEFGDTPWVDVSEGGKIHEAILNFILPSGEVALKSFSVWIEREQTRSTATDSEYTMPFEEDQTWNTDMTWDPYHHSNAPRHSDSPWELKKEPGIVAVSIAATLCIIGFLTVIYLFLSALPH